jgi:hypothetical protein
MNKSLAPSAAPASGSAGAAEGGEGEFLRGGLDQLSGQSWRRPSAGLLLETVPTSSLAAAGLGCGLAAAGHRLTPKPSWTVQLLSGKTIDTSLEAKAASQVVAVFSSSFPECELQSGADSLSELVQNSVGFHDLEDCIWAILLQREGADDEATTVIGLATIAVCHNMCVLFNLCVHKAERGKGHAVRLARALSKEALKKGKSCLTGMVDVRKAGLVRYYTSRGAVQEAHFGMGGGSGKSFQPSSIRLRFPLSDALVESPQFGKRVAGGSLVTLVTTFGLLAMLAVNTVFS